MIFSLLGLLLFGTASATCYLWVARIEQPSDAIFSGIRLGKQSFDIYNEKFCVGGFETEFKDDPGLTLILRGQMRATFRGKTYLAKLFAGSFFNSLNQLVSSNIQVESEGDAVLLSLSQPNPLRARLSATRSGKSMVLRELELPGPVELVKASDGSFRVSYVGLRGNIQRMLQQFSPLQALPQNMAMPLLRVEQGVGDGVCGSKNDGDPEALAGFSLDALIDKLPHGGAFPLPFGSNFLSQPTTTEQK